MELPPPEILNYQDSKTLTLLNPDQEIIVVNKVELNLQDLTKVATLIFKEVAESKLHQLDVLRLTYDDREFYKDQYYSLSQEWWDYQSPLAPVLASINSVSRKKYRTELPVEMPNFVYTTSPIHGNDNEDYCDVDHDDSRLCIKIKKYAAMVKDHSAYMSKHECTAILDRNKEISAQMGRVQYWLSYPKELNDRLFPYITQAVMMGTLTPNDFKPTIAKISEQIVEDLINKRPTNVEFTSNNY